MNRKEFKKGINRGIKAIILIFTTFFTTNAISQNSWYDGLEYGSHTVGFKVISTKDFSRPYKTGKDSSFIPRPMQMGIWYPATSDKTGSTIHFGYLLALENSDETLERVDPTLVTKPSEKYEQYFPPEELDLVFNKPMHSKLNASAQKGNFPIIIYGSSQGSSGYDNAMLCEQIASHGFIVVTVASKGAYSRQMPFNTEGAEAQARDLEFLFGQMYTYPNADEHNIGTVGFSFGGLNMVTFSLKNTRVKAMVSLDGSISSPSGVEILNSYSYLNVKNFNSNFLGFLGDKSTINNFPIIDQAFLSDMYLLKLSKLNHPDFSSFNLMIHERPDYVHKAYVDMANLTVKFLNHNFKNDLAFDRAIANYSKDIYSGVKQKKSKGTPTISKEEYINYIKENGIEEGIQIYYETKSNFPEYQLFDYDPFRDIGFMKMMEKDYKGAIKVYKVLLEEFPDNPDSYRRLGEAYMHIGNFSKARKLINNGLKLDPKSPAMNDILRLINEKDK